MKEEHQKINEGKIKSSIFLIIHWTKRWLLSYRATYQVSMARKRDACQNGWEWGACDSPLEDAGTTCETVQCYLKVDLDLIKRWIVNSRASLNF